MKCWQPPLNYCAGGAKQVITKACDPNDGLCCSFQNSCIPCGWVDCFENAAHPSCAAGATSGGACDAFQPDLQAMICWDRIDKE